VTPLPNDHSTNEKLPVAADSNNDSLTKRPRSLTSEEFISDSFSDSNVNMVALQKELGQLGISPTSATLEAAIRKEIESSLGSSPTSKLHEPSNDEILEINDEAWEEQLKKELEEDINTSK
jgi:hypothetical protein